MTSNTPRLAKPLPLQPGVKGDAKFSDCGRYRFWLSRVWSNFDSPRMVAFIGLNPSCAAADVDDRTVRKCQTLARSWGYDGIYMLNLFAYRATAPEEMIAFYASEKECIADRAARSFFIGYNYSEIDNMIGLSLLTVCAWGTHGEILKAGECQLNMLKGKQIYHLGLTKHGHPKHPLYLKNSVQPILWE